MTGRTNETKIVEYWNLLKGVDRHTVVHHIFSLLSMYFRMFHHKFKNMNSNISGQKNVRTGRSSSPVVGPNMEPCHKIFFKTIHHMF